MATEFPPRKKSDPLKEIRQTILQSISQNAGNGLKIGSTARVTGIDVELARLVVNQLVDSGIIERVGQTRGARYIAGSKKLSSQAEEVDLSDWVE